MPSQVESSQVESRRGESSRVESSRVESSRGESCRVKSSRVESSEGTCLEIGGRVEGACLEDELDVFRWCELTASRAHDMCTARAQQRIRGHTSAQRWSETRNSSPRMTRRWWEHRGLSVRRNRAAHFGKVGCEQRVLSHACHAHGEPPGPSERTIR
jgi:hypothetical protein